MMWAAVYMQGLVGATQTVSALAADRVVSPQGERRALVVAICGQVLGVQEVVGCCMLKNIIFKR